MRSRTDGYTAGQLAEYDAELARLRIRALALLGNRKRLRGHPDILRAAHKIVIDSLESSACWEWQGASDRFGYGLLRPSDTRQTAPAHRLVWERVVEVIPAGWRVDHLCVNPRCCRPSHLEPVTHGENIRRGYQDRARRKLAADTLRLAS